MKAVVLEVLTVDAWSAQCDSYVEEGGEIQHMTDDQKKIAEIFAEVLKRETVALDDDFIQLGGDSMSAMLCISRIRTEFQVELSVEDFFIDNASVRTVSLMIDDLNKNSAT